MRHLIKIKLDELRLSQKDVIDKLRERGYAITKGEFSSFLSGRKQTPKAERILDAAWDIVCEFEEEERKKYIGG